MTMTLQTATEQIFVLLRCLGDHNMRAPRRLVSKAYVARQWIRQHASEAEKAILEVRLKQRVLETLRHCEAVQIARN